MNSSCFTINQKVEVIIDKPRVSKKVFKGHVVYISDHFITVQNDIHIRECFKFVDFNIGKIALRH